ncbi:MAG: Dps family protein [Rhodovibrionaceae bacterium]
MQPNVGIGEADREAVAEGLKRVMADSYTLYLKTHNFHWNVTGPQFQTLHTMFEEQYTELWNAVDDIAERIRALGQHAPGSYKAFAKLTSLEETELVPKADEMVRQLAEDHEAVVRTARTVLHPAQEAEDEVTLGLLTDRMTVHEKTAWMLRSLAG